MGGRVKDTKARKILKDIHYSYALAVIMIIVSLIALVWGCSYALFDEGHNGDNNKPPTAYASPLSGSDINGSTQIVIRFSESMNTSTLSLGGDMASDSIEVAWTKTNYEDDTLTISPIETETWTEGSDRGLTVDCKDLSGSPLSQLILSYTVAIAPQIPTGLMTSDPTVSSLTISWDSVSGATSYQLYRDTDNYTTAIYDGANTNHLDDGLDSGTTYYYKVRASNEYVSSDLSDAVEGTTLMPEISVRQGAIDIPSTGTAYFGSVGINTQNDVTFVIENFGTSSLNLTGTPDKVAIVGTDASLFTPIVQPESPITPDSSSPFTIRFTTESTGSKTATIIIYNDDPNEGTYTFTITATGIFPWASPPKTGQVTSWVTGDDGDLMKGVSWPSPRFTDNLDSTITDNLTGLMWEKSPSSVTRNWDSALNYPITLTLGDYSDWRLPNIIELESLVNSEVSNPANWLTSQGFTNVQSWSYWASTTYVPITDFAWGLVMDRGLVSYLLKSTDDVFYTWAVRVAGTGAVTLAVTGQVSSYRYLDDGMTRRGISWPDPRFTDNGNGTMTDTLTGLMWEKTPSIVKGLWIDALNPANDLLLAGYSDWRLPNRKELWSLLNFESSDTAAWLNEQGFSGIQSDYYWSSTTYGPDTSRASIIGVHHGYIGYGNKPLDDLYFWAVRGGQ